MTKRLKISLGTGVSMSLIAEINSSASSGGK